MRKLMIGLLCLSFGVTGRVLAEEWYRVFEYHLLRWLWLYEFDPRIGRLINQHYITHPDKRMNEMVANLACWQAGVRDDDYN